MEYQHLPVFQVSINDTVFTFFPCCKLMRLFVNHHIFVFYRHQPAKYIDGEHPFVLSFVFHSQIAAGAP